MKRFNILVIVFAALLACLCSCDAAADFKLWNWTHKLTIDFSSLASNSTFFYDEDYTRQIQLDEDNCLVLVVRHGELSPVTEIYRRKSVEGGGFDDTKCTFDYVDPEGVRIAFDLETTPVTADITICPVGYCVMYGTMVTMADGSLLPVQEVELGDMVLTWDFYEGAFVANEVLAFEANEAEQVEVMTLTTEDGHSIRFTYMQTFIDADADQAIIISRYNCDSMVGRRILVQDGDCVVPSRIVSIVKSTEYLESFDIITAHAYNFLGDGIVNMYPGILQVLPFEMDDSYRYLQSDIDAKRARYGILTYDDVSEYVSSAEMFELFHLEDMKVIMGIGAFDWDYFLYAIRLFRSYGLTGQ